MQVSREQMLYNLIVDHSNRTLKRSLQTLGRGYQTPTPSNLRKNARKSIGGDIGSSRKRPRKETPATSSTSLLTNISSISRSSEPMIDYQKPAKTQENFVVHYQDCNPFGVDETFTINIEQMIVA
jgi:hypothetical protein